jgi:cell shape-determining protein MreD
MTAGFFHDIVGIGIIGKLTPRSTLIFLFFGIFSLLSRNLQKVFHQNRWSPILNIIVNVVFVLISIILGYFLNRLLMTNL